jgi:integrase
MAKKKNTRRPKGAGSIFRKKSSRNWYYKNLTKNISAISLGTSVYKDAVEVAKEKYGYLELEDEQKQQERLMLNYEFTKQRIENDQKAIILLDSMLSEYGEAVKLSRRSKGKDDELKQSTKVIVNNFINWVKANCCDVQTMDKVTAKIAQDYFNSKNCKASSYNRYLVELRVVWSRINKRHMRSFNPFESVTKIESNTVKKETASKRPFTPDEFKTISVKATGWIRLAVIIGYHSGLRLSDVITLKNTDISADGFISFESKKTGKDQLLFCPEILPALQEWRKNVEVTEYVFQEQAETYLGLRNFLPSARSKDRNRSIKPNPTKASKLFQKFLRDTCKFKTKSKDGTTILGFHSLRVSNATYSERIGVSRDKIKENLAHSDMRVTEGYIQRQLEEIKREMILSHKSLPALDSAEYNDEVTNLKAKIMSMEATNIDDFKHKLTELLA